MVDIADIVIPDHLSSEDEAHAGILLGHLKDSAVRLDEAIQSAANWPSSDPGRGNRARTEALILLEGLRSLERQGSILPPSFVPLWIEEMNDRLRDIAVCEPIDSPPMPPAPRSIRAVRPFSVRRPSFDPSNDAAIHDYVNELVKKARSTHGHLMVHVAFAVDSDRSLLAEALALALHDEVHIRLEYEALSRLAERDLRPVPNEVRHIVREALQQAGLLPAQSTLA